MDCRIELLNLFLCNFLANRWPMAWESSSIFTAIAVYGSAISGAHNERPFLADPAMKPVNSPETVGWTQGDQIGRIFPY
jgi:hypothetical protein